MRGRLGVVLSACLLVGMVAGCGGTAQDLTEDVVATEATELKAAQPGPENFSSRNCEDLIPLDCAPEGAVVKCYAGGRGYLCTCETGSWNCAP